MTARDAGSGNWGTNEPEWSSSDAGESTEAPERPDPSPPLEEAEKDDDWGADEMEEE